MSVVSSYYGRQFEAGSEARNVSAERIRTKRRGKYYLGSFELLTVSIIQD